MEHEPGGTLTRRTVLRLMAAAGAGRAPGAAGETILARPIPSSGERVPALGLGTWRTFDVGTSAAERAPLTEVLGRFVALGGRVLDSSPMYGAAELVAGDLATELGVVDRLFVATKVWTSGREAERRILPLARDRGIAVLVNRPFSAGDLFQRVRRASLPAWVAALGCHSWAQLFLKWILGHPAVTCVIPATSRLEHLVDNMTAGVGPLPDEATRERMRTLVASR